MIDREFVGRYAKVMRIKKPIEIRVRFENHVNDAEYFAKYSESGKVKRHVITVFISDDNCRDIETLIVHELIHAYQEENNRRDKFHGKTFQRMARKFSEYPNIYLNGVDV